MDDEQLSTETAQRPTWLNGILLAQIVLIWLMVFLVFRDTRLGGDRYPGGRYRPDIGCFEFGHDYVYTGYPAPWGEFYQTLWNEDGTSTTIDRKSELVGINFPVLVAFALFAICTPCGLAGLWRQLHQQPVSSMWVRWCWVLCPMAMAALFVAWAEAELTIFPGRSPFQQRLPDRWPASTPIKRAYEEQLVRVRNRFPWITYTYPAFRGAYPQGKSRWTSRNIWTFEAMLAMGIACALVVRPWRRPIGPALPAGTPATTPPTS